MTVDALTILETHGQIVAAKRIRLRDGQPPEVLDYDNAKHFGIIERSVGSIEDVAELLSKVERHPRYMMIRGRALPGIDHKNALRRKSNGRADGDACFAEAAHHLIERTSAAFVHAINIVQVLRPIDTQANKEIVLLEKSTPFVIE